MAIAYAVVKRNPDLRETIVDVTLDGSYSAGGYALDGKSMGLLASKPEHVQPVTKTVHGVVPSWDEANNKLVMWKTGSATSGVFIQAAAGDLSTSVIVRCLVKGNVKV